MQSVRNSALRLLARRDHSRSELERKLCLRKFTLAEINPILDELEHDNLLSQNRFIGSYIRTRRSKGYGPLKICAELSKHGIDHHCLRANEEWQEVLWQESAIAVRKKRFGEAIPQDKPERLQQARFLQQRGFNTDQIRTALRS